MPENRPFTAYQDQLIKTLYEDEKITKWAIISRKLTEEFNLPRNAKQCRDRYQQFLDPLMQSQWTQEEELKLFKLHDEIGNKWALIAFEFQGKNDNCVKNHFYSKLRKTMRKLNKVISTKFKREFKQIKIAMIYKVVEAFEQQFKEKPMIEQEVSEYCMKLKNRLLAYSTENEANMNDQDYSLQKEIIMDIFNFNKGYKKKSKKERRSSIQVSSLFKVPQKRMKVFSDQQSSESEFSFTISHQYQNEESPSQKYSNQSQKLLVVVEQDEIRQSQNSKVSINMYGEKNELLLSGKMSEDKPNSVEEILRGSAALEIGKFPSSFYNNRDASFKSFSNRSQSEKPDMFCDDLRFSGGLKQMEEEVYDDLRFSGGIRSSNKIEQQNAQDLHRSHR